jgi:hypothetical protein
MNSISNGLGLKLAHVTHRMSEEPFLTRDDTGLGACNTEGRP